MSSQEGYQFGPFQIDLNERVCRRGDEFIPLTGKAFDLLLLLVRDAGRTLTKAELMVALWPDTAVEEKNLTQTIFLLRKALGDDSGRAKYIQTLPRVGYKLVAPVTFVGIDPQNGQMVETAKPTGDRPSRPWRWLATAAVVFAVFAAGWMVSRFRQPRASEQLAFRLQLEPPEGGRFVLTGWYGGMVAVSPDGKTAAYIVERDGKTELWIRPLEGTDARPLEGTDGAKMPFWSPDNKSIAFFSSFASGNKLLRAELAGGAPVPICDVPGAAWGGAWTDTGRIIFASVASNGLLQVPASGGNATTLTRLDSSRGETFHWWPQALPGGRFLYSVSNVKPENAGVFAASFANPTQRTRLIAAPWRAVFAPGGDGKDYLLWSRGSAVVAQQLDLSALKMVTEPRPVVDPVMGWDLYAASMMGGVLLYATPPPPRRLMWLDRSGKSLGQAGEPGEYTNFRISPEGSRVALARVLDRHGPDLWVLETARGISSRLTSNPGASHMPVWSPDGRRILFSNGLPFNLYLREASGAETQLRVTDKETMQGSLDWSRDGRLVLYFETGHDTQVDLWYLSMTPDGKPLGHPKPYLNTRFNERLARFSPEPSPHWVAYESDESGPFEVYVQSFPEPHGARRISTAGGNFPQWNANGRELFYVSPDDKLMAVRLKVESDSVEPSPPRELFPLPSQPRDPLKIPYDVAPDGQRFLVQGPDQQRAPALTVVVNWPALLK